MNVLQILPRLDQGGVETGTVDFARYLTAHGHKAVVISGGGRLARRLEEAGIKHYTLPVGRKNPLNMVLMIPKIADIIHKENIHIVHARSRVPAFSAYFAARKMRKKFITTAHGHYRKHFFSSCMGWGRYVIVASHVIAKHMIDSFGVPVDKIRLIPRGIDIEKFSAEENLEKLKNPRKDKPFVIVNVARITPLKGHDDFLKAIALIARKIPKIKVLIVGAPGRGKERYFEQLKMLTRQLGIAEYVTFTGLCEDIPALLAKADLLCLSTKTPEAFGRTIVEAQASGVPVIATRVGGVVDIIEDGINGLLCFPEDSKSMGEAIMRIYEDKELAYNLALAARAKVEEKYTLDKMGEETIACYKDALESKNILVIKLSALGDVILVIPSLRAIRAKYPDAHIKVMVGRPFYRIISRSPYVNDVIVYDLDRKAHPFNVLRTARELRKGHFDLCFDFQNSRLSHLMAFLSLAPIRCGYDNKKWSFLINRRVRDIGMPVNPIEHQFKTLRLLGIEPKEYDLELWTSKHDEAWVDDFLKSHWIGKGQGFIIVNPFASPRWQSKNWTDEKYAKFVDECAQTYNMRIIFVGTEETKPRTHEIAGMSKSKPIVANGSTNIAQLVALISRARLLFTTDSAPLHIASARNIPFVALFGPTDPQRHVWSEANHRILTGPKRCRPPCYKTKCSKTRSCIAAITVEEALNAVKELWVK